MASFHEALLPTGYDRNSSFGPGFNTSIFQKDSGHEARFSHWTSARRRFQVTYQKRSLDELAEVLTFFHARKGSAYGFRFRDKSDFTTAANHKGSPLPTDVLLVEGSTPGTYQLRKLYGAVVRNLTKPVSGTVRVSVDDVEVTVGWSVSTTTGIITFLSPPSGVVKAGCQFDIPVRFLNDNLELTHVDYEAGSSGVIELIELKVD